MTRAPHRSMRVVGILVVLLGLVLPALSFPTRAESAPPVIGAIRDEWLRSRDKVGEPLGPEFCGLRNGGCGQRFQRGSIYWSMGSGAHHVVGWIRERWGSLRWEAGYLGYPTSGEFCGLRNGGCFQRYQGGSIYWSPASGAQDIRGSIRDVWWANGWENGINGYPTSGEFCGLLEGGCGQRFQNGNIYYHPRHGTHRVFGAIFEGWARLRWENSPIGYPAAGEACGLRDRGCFQRFANGFMYWSPGTGAYAVHGQILAHWAANGRETGRYGYPTSNESCRLEGDVRICEQTFQRDRIVWRSDTGIVSPGGIPDCTTQRCLVALTFEDGPSAHTGRLLDTLQREDAKATFFLTGENVRRDPATARRIRDLGMEIGNHTVTQPDLTGLTCPDVSCQVAETQWLIRNATGVTATYFRPPSGAMNDNVDRVARDLKMGVALWSVDGQDGQGATAATVSQRVLAESRPGSVILLRDGNGVSADAAPAIITGLKSRGYTLVTMTELHGAAEPGRVYRAR